VGYGEKSKMSMYWGYHLMLDCSGCEGITDADNIRAFVKKLVKKIDMVAVGDPWIERTAIGIPDKEGFSMYQLIVTSNVSAHFIDEARHIYLDVFSCKEFSIDTVKEVVTTYFNPTKMKINFVTRNAD
jgi:S-adenosylmethionine/arginine decarboxylase-like enzyme